MRANSRSRTHIPWKPGKIERFGRKRKEESVNLDGLSNSGIIYQNREKDVAVALSGPILTEQDLGRFDPLSRLRIVTAYGISDCNLDQQIAQDPSISAKEVTEAVWKGLGLKREPIFARGKERI